MGYKESSDINESSFTVYPNHANNSVTASINAEKTEKFQLLVTDITIRAVFTRSDYAIAGNNKVQVNLIGIDGGTYLIIVKNEIESCI